MFGFGDWYIVCAVIGCVAVTLFGVVYGALNWNNSGEKEK